jgi:hypothetical protein
MRTYDHEDGVPCISMSWTGIEKKNVMTKNFFGSVVASGLRVQNG